MRMGGRESRREGRRMGGRMGGRVGGREGIGGQNNFRQSFSSLVFTCTALYMVPIVVVDPMVPWVSEDPK